MVIIDIAKSLSSIILNSLKLGDKTVEVANTSAEFVNSAVKLSTDTVGVARKSTEVANATQTNIIQALSNAKDITDASSKFSVETINNLTELLKPLSATSQKGIEALTAVGAILNEVLSENKSVFANVIVSPVNMVSTITDGFQKLLKIVLVLPFDAFEAKLKEFINNRTNQIEFLRKQQDQVNEIKMLELEVQKMEKLIKLNKLANEKQAVVDSSLHEGTLPKYLGVNNAVKDQFSNVKDTRETIEKVIKETPAGSNKTSELGNISLTPKVDYDVNQLIEFTEDNKTWKSGNYISAKLDENGNTIITIKDKEGQDKNIGIDKTRSISIVRPEFRGGRNVLSATFKRFRRRNKSAKKHKKTRNRKTF